MSKKIIIANWKMHKLGGDVEPYCYGLTQRQHRDVDVCVAPPFPLLANTVAAAKENELSVLAQNVHAATQGAFTGEVSPLLLADLGVRGAIVGHSERRTLFNEDDETVAHKVQACLQAGLQPFLCVGESAAQREQGSTQTVLQQQLHCVLKLVQCTSLCVAYEPVWAIGTGKTAQPEQVQAAHSYLKECAQARDCTLTVLYGGSVNPDNAATLLSLPDVDGVLVGGASLQVEKFNAIINAS